MFKATIKIDSQDYPIVIEEKGSLPHGSRAIMHMSGDKDGLSDWVEVYAMTELEASTRALAWR